MKIKGKEIRMVGRRKLVRLSARTDLGNGIEDMNLLETLPDKNYNSVNENITPAEYFISRGMEK